MPTWALHVSGIAQVLLIFHNSIEIPIPCLRYCIPIQNSKTCSSLFSFQNSKLCREYHPQTPSKGDLIQHHRAINEGKKYSCSECDNQATSKGDLTQHQQSIHEEKYYNSTPASSSSKNKVPARNLTTSHFSKNDLTHHQRATHVGKKYSSRNMTTRELLTVISFITLLYNVLLLN